MSTQGYISKNLHTGTHTQITHDLTQMLTLTNTHAHVLTLTQTPAPHALREIHAYVHVFTCVHQAAPCVGRVCGGVRAVSGVHCEDHVLVCLCVA